MSNISKKINTKLSLDKKDESIISDTQKEILQEEIEELLPIEKDDVNISTIYVFEQSEELEAKVYFRNGLSQNINFEYVPLILLNSEDEEIGRNVFDLREMGDLPSCTARPWKIYFKKSEIHMDKFTPNKCRVIFDRALKAVNYANIEYEKILEELIKFKPRFESFLQELPKIEKGQLAISTFNISLNVNSNIYVTLVIRNSSDKSIKVEQIPVTLKDEDDNIIVSGKFNLKEFIIKPIKARICNLSFEVDLTPEKTENFSNKWKVIFE
ncbi:SLAP domain-containing protein [Clostridium kluyveri]|uniref:SLAP domain-containing protein n=1 Tax=Clostridium kluyveri TaxID=1534 RepID=A0A1L5FBZ6_CLOKL|nr:SLAP domain-containing protein [Clostridium kluyveri]APM40340.1 SLAP domain-containing protein [Clostridium kluyveri]